MTKTGCKPAKQNNKQQTTNKKQLLWQNSLNSK